jgi:hypothetical protein
VIAQAVAGLGRGRGESGTTIGHLVLLLSQEEAERSLLILREDGGSCETWTESEALGGLTWTQTEFDTPDLGDETVLLRASAEDSPLRIAVVITRRGPLVSNLFVFSGPEGELTPEELDEVANEAESKLERAFDSLR